MSVGAVVFLVAGLLGAGGTAYSYRKSVWVDPGAHMAPEAIRAVIQQESPVYHRDGVTRLGVFFDAEHRDYVPFEALPDAYVASLVAAEDARYWRHKGVDAWGIARAMRDNILAGGVVAGGSTLTQQTAKNLFYRPDRSLGSKWTELVNALRLEAHYSKEEILEFYVNQFHVTGNGRGAGVAATHFFDRDLSELGLVECAFLAGLVKAPSRYDPFLGSEERRERALVRSHERVRYVLERLVTVPAEDLVGETNPTARAAALDRVAEIKKEAAGLLEGELDIPFRRGTFRYESSSILDEVAQRLTRPPFDRVLADAGVTDPATAGLKVVTTLDANLQRESTYALWHHLTEVGVALESSSLDVFRRDGSRALRFDPDRPPEAHTFRMGDLTSDPLDEVRGRRVDLAGSECWLDRAAFRRVGEAIKRGEQRTRHVTLREREVDALMTALEPGVRVLVSVRDVTQEGGARCDLEVRPVLQGAAVVLEEGQVRAMVTGNDNRDFNRVRAPRQLGSTWKPLIYHAAIQLGWSPLDRLDNRRGVFPFSTTFYYPRPDHDPEPSVSMAWAGVRSENLASIWLLYHLVDRMDGEQVRALSQELGLLRQPDESERDYRQRVQLMGVLPTRSRRVEGWFLQSKSELLSGMGETLDAEERLALMSLLYGWGYQEERVRVGKGTPRERARAEQALNFSWRHLSAQMPGCAKSYSALEDAWRVIGEQSGQEPDAEKRFTRFDDLDGLYVLGGGATVDVTCGVPPAGAVSAYEWLLERGHEEEDTPPVALPGQARMWVGERLRYGTLENLSDAIRRRQLADELRESPLDLYSPEVLLWQQDFRVLLALHYVEGLAKRYGVQEDIPLVLSMPLGAVELPLDQAAMLYTGLMTGERWHFPGEGVRGELGPSPSSTLLISEIRTADDRLIYKADATSIEVGKPLAAQQTADILHNVVRWGTGRRAKEVVDQGGALLPVAGKTGTTNQYRNAAFLGYVPRGTKRGQPTMGEGPVIGVYVGYDDNRPMTQGSLRIAGASGALPAWVGIAKAVAASGDALHRSPGGEALVEVEHAPGLIRVSVQEKDGLASDVKSPEGPRVLVSRSTLVSTDLGVAPPVRDPEEPVDPEAIRAMERWIRGVRVP